MKRFFKKSFSILCPLCFILTLSVLDSMAEEKSTKEFGTPSEGGRIAIVDPQTNQLVSGEAAKRVMEREAFRAGVEDFAARFRAKMVADLNVSGLEEKQLATGAVKVDLKGHFRSPVLAIVEPDRTIAITHGSSTSKD